MVEDTEPTYFVSSSDKLFLPERNQPYRDVLSPHPPPPGLLGKGLQRFGGFQGLQEVDRRE